VATSGSGALRLGPSWTAGNCLRHWAYGRVTLQEQRGALARAHKRLHIHAHTLTYTYYVGARHARLCSPVATTPAETTLAAGVWKGPHRKPVREGRRATADALHSSFLPQRLLVGNKT
jgi:hypothetical protein